MILLIHLILAQLMIGGTPHPVSVTWSPIIITQTNDDGTTFDRPPLGYLVYRAPIINGVIGTYILLNPDSIVEGLIIDDLLEYIDETATSGADYNYQVTALDYAGESPPSNQSGDIPIPMNPDAPTLNPLVLF